MIIWCVVGVSNESVTGNNGSYVTAARVDILHASHSLVMCEELESPLSRINELKDCPHHNICVMSLEDAEKLIDEAEDYKANHS